jgi:hypothetical protein
MHSSRQGRLGPAKTAELQCTRRRPCIEAALDAILIYLILNEKMVPGAELNHRHTDFQPFFVAPNYLI